MSRPRAKKIKLLILDVDGVMTDGKIFMVPAPAELQQALREDRAKYADKGGYSVSSDSMFEVKGFNAHDGAGISLARLGGLKTAVITKRVSETVRIRCRDLHIDYVYQGISDKLSTMQEILTKEGLTAEQAAYVGDDVIDLPPMRVCGLAVAVANARESVKQAAHIITEHVGGDGAVRDAIEYILKAQGTLDRVVATYIGEPSPD
jgi:3-deoxy-D-manno-octulosonate 8-phosphate phosphatase (KDO 8-P phosphatase)